MMKDLYSTYEAKAKLSEILRHVRSGKTIRISHRGVPVAEVRPIDRKPTNFEDRLRQLADQGALLRCQKMEVKLSPLTKKSGALGRFLKDRNQ